VPLTDWEGARGPHLHLAPMLTKGRSVGAGGNGKRAVSSVTMQTCVAHPPARSAAACRTHTQLECLLAGRVAEVML